MTSFQNEASDGPIEKVIYGPTGQRPVAFEADRILRERGVVIIPDLFAKAV